METYLALYTCSFDWMKHSQVRILMKKLIFLQKPFSVKSNFIPNEAVTLNDRDPPWINNKIKKTEYFKNCVKPNNPESIRM